MGPLGRPSDAGLDGTRTAPGLRSTSVRRSTHVRRRPGVHPIAVLDERPQSLAPFNFPARAAETLPMTPTATLPRSDRRLVFTSSQAARYLGVSLATIRRWTDAGHISCYRTPGGQRRFAREQLDVFVTSMHRSGRNEEHGYGGARELDVHDSAGAA